MAAAGDVEAEAVVVADALRPRLGIGIGWRPEIDLTVSRMAGIDFVEVVAENLPLDRLPEPIRQDGHAALA